MLSIANVLKSFLAEAMRTVVNLIYVSPLTPLDGDVSERVLTKKDISYKYLRVFGCWACVHVSKDEKLKLDNKANECIFLSYRHEKFGYKLQDPVAKKLSRSRDVMFL